MRKISEKYQTGEITGDGIICYIPEISNSHSVTQKEYKGYNGYTYRDDVVYVPNTSSAVKVIAKKIIVKTITYKGIIFQSAVQ